MAGGFQRPDHSSAEDEEPKLVIGVPQPHSNTPHNCHFQGDWRDFCVLALRFHAVIFAVSNTESASATAHRCAGSSSWCLSRLYHDNQAAQLKWNFLFTPTRQGRGFPTSRSGLCRSERPSRSLKVLLFMLHYRGGQKSLGGRVLPQWD